MFDMLCSRRPAKTGDLSEYSHPLQSNFEPYTYGFDAHPYTMDDDPNWGGKPDPMKFGSLNKLGFLANQKRMSGKKKEKQHSKTAMRIMLELGAESNAHGLAKIATSNATKRKVLWALLVIIGFTAATLQLSLLVGKFLDYKVVEVSNMKDGMPVEFPAVTICNIATYSMTRVSELIQQNNQDILGWLTLIDQANFGAQDARMDSHQAFYENLPEITKQIAFNISNLIVHCRFNQRDCGPMNFTLFFDGKNYYNCYTFNSGYGQNSKEMKEEKILMHTTGPQNGLSLIISLDNDKPPDGAYGIYDEKNHIGFSGGVRAQVHAPNTMPSPADHGFDVPPGYSSSVSLKAILHTRLPHPHGNCTFKQLDGEDRKYKNTIFHCLQLCKQRILVKICGCKTSALPMYKIEENDKTNGSDIPFCGHIKNWKIKADLLMKKSKVELSTLICEQRVLENLNNDRSYENSCKCFQPCQETSYQKSLSLSYWPLDFYQLTALRQFYKDREIKTQLIKEAFDNLDGIQSRFDAYQAAGIHAEYNKTDIEDKLRASTIIRQNLLRLNIYLEDLSIVEFTQMPDYDLADLFADIGGTLGLWMGISVLTIMELVELMLRLVMLLFDSENDIFGTDCDPDEQPDQQTEQNHIMHNSRFDQFHYDQPLHKQHRYDKNQCESPI